MYHIPLLAAAIYDVSLKEGWEELGAHTAEDVGGSDGPNFFPESRTFPKKGGGGGRTQLEKYLKAERGEGRKFGSGVESGLSNCGAFNATDKLCFNDSRLNK